MHGKCFHFVYISAQKNCSKGVTFSARNTNLYKLRKLCEAILFLYFIHHFPIELCNLAKLMFFKMFLLS